MENKMVRLYEEHVFSAIPHDSSDFIKSSLSFDFYFPFSKQKHRKNLTNPFHREPRLSLIKIRVEGPRKGVNE